MLEQQHTTKQILLSELIVGKLRPLNSSPFVLPMFMHDLIFKTGDINKPEIFAYNSYIDSKSYSTGRPSCQSYNKDRPSCQLYESNKSL